MTGKQKADETVARLKEENQQSHLNPEKPVGKAGPEEMKNALAVNAQVQQMMQNDAREEAQNNGSLPWLKIYIANRSTSVLLDGTEPNDGWFFYGPTKEQYQEIYCNLLVISRGYYAEGLPDDEGKIKINYHNMLAGVIINDDPKPFFLDIAGKARRDKLWEFQKVVREWNTQGFPMFPMVIKMTTVKVLSEVKGRSPARAITFDIVKDDKNFPDINLSAEEYAKLKTKRDKLALYVEEYIKRREVPKPGEDVPHTIKTGNGVTVDGTTVFVTPKTQEALPRPDGTEDVDPDQIPF